MVKAAGPVFLLFLFVFPFFHLFADVGPKPSMKFTFTYGITNPVKIIEGWQLESPMESFTIFDTLTRKGPQGFEVSGKQASSISYGYLDYHKLVIRFDDRIRTSNVFRNESFNSQYEVYVFEDRLEVKDVTPFMKNSSAFSAFLKALLVTLVLELLVAFVYLKLAKKPIRVLFTVILGNLITLPMIWFILPLFLNVGASIIVGELFAFMTEAMLLLVLSPYWFRMGGAFFLSFMMNLMSLLVGGFALILMIGF